MTGVQKLLFAASVTTLIVTGWTDRPLSAIGVQPSACLDNTVRQLLGNSHKRSN